MASTSTFERRILTEIGDVGIDAFEITQVALATAVREWILDVLGHFSHTIQGPDVSKLPLNFSSIVSVFHCCF